MLSVQTHGASFLFQKKNSISKLFIADFDYILVLLTRPMTDAKVCYVLSDPVSSNRPRNQFLNISSSYWLNNVTSLLSSEAIMIVKSTTVTKGHVCVGTVSCLGSFPVSPMYCKKITGKMGSRRTIFIDLNQVTTYLVPRC